MFSYTEQAGDTLQAGDLAITPISKVLIIKPPGHVGGLIWNRPIAVRINKTNNKTQVLPIPDVTRQALLLFFGIGLIFICVASLQRPQRNRSNRERKLQ